MNASRMCPVWVYIKRHTYAHTHRVLNRTVLTWSTFETNAWCMGRLIEESLLLRKMGMHWTCRIFPRRKREAKVPGMCLCWCACVYVVCCWMDGCEPVYYYGTNAWWRCAFVYRIFWSAFTHTHSLLFSLFVSHSLTHTHSLSLFFSSSLSLTDTHILSLALALFLSLSLTHWHTLSLSLFLARSLSLSFALSLSLSLSFSLTHWHTHTSSLALFLSLSLSLSFSLFLSHSDTHSISCTNKHRPKIPIKKRPATRARIWGSAMHTRRCHPAYNAFTHTHTHIHTHTYIQTSNVPLMLSHTHTHTHTYTHTHIQTSNVPQ